MCSCQCLSVILWWLFGGLILGLVWLLLSAICVISIIGCFTGWATQCFKIAQFCLWPHSGSVRRQNVSACECGCDCICNILWLIFIGWEMFLAHAFCALLLCIFGVCGIKLAEYHWDLARIALAPYGAVFTSEGGFD